MRSRVLSLLLLAAVALVPLSALPSWASAAPGPDFHRPAVGACYDYGVRGSYAVSGPRAEVACDQSHRAVIVAVPRIQGSIEDRKDPKIFDKVGVRCYRALYKTLGGTQESRALTAYGITYYVPTQAEVDKGARWVRCDLNLFGGTKLMALPDPLTSTTPDDSTALCLVKDDAASTVCSRKHRYRATGVVPVKGDAYPGPDKLDRIGAKKCASRVSSEQYVWRYGSELAWKAGRHVVTCFTKTRA